MERGMGRARMSIAAIDIGTNSMRMLVLSENGDEVFRGLEVTGLGVGVDAVGRFDEDRMNDTLAVMARFGEVISSLKVRKVGAVATSATRDATNGPSFVRAVSERIGVVPDIIPGEREAKLSFMGATRALETGLYLVIDIGGGSTEFIRGAEQVEESVSVDLGSVRLTDRMLATHPTPRADRVAAASAATALFSDVPLAKSASVIGVAGTFTSLAGIVQRLPQYDRSAVDGFILERSAIEDGIDELASLTIDQIAAIPSLHPKRAPVIIAGAVIAGAALDAVGATSAIVSESDLLTGLAHELLST